MIEVAPGLFVGEAADEERVRGKPGWFVISAAKMPYHRDALGYEGVAAPKDHPEYLIAHRPGRLILNLIDAPDPAYIPDAVIDAALDAIEANRTPNTDVLVHCNQGHSRAPMIAFMWMHNAGRLPDDFETALDMFGQMYVPLAPANGMLEYARAHW